MPEFAYTARSAAGEDIVGSLSASGQREAVAVLNGRGLFPLKLEDVGDGQQIGSWPVLRRRVRSDQIVAILTQLSDLLQNGVPLLASLEILSQQTPHPTMCEVLSDIHDQVAEGVRLDEAFARHPAIFSELSVSMIRAGMEGAFLEDALRRVAGFLERQEELKGRVVGAMAYPVFLAVVGTIVTTVLVIFFVPKFEPLFERLQRTGGGLPTVTIALLWMSDTLAQFGWFILAALVGVGVMIKKSLASPATQRHVDAFKLRLPVAGTIFHNAAVSRFCRYSRDVAAERRAHPQGTTDQ